MLSLTKLTSSGLTGLSVSGLGTFFLPKYTDNSKETQLVYSELGSTSAEIITEKEKQEKPIILAAEKQLSELLESSKHLQNLQTEKQSQMKKQFEIVQSDEKELLRLYEEVKKLLQQLGELEKQATDRADNKLKVQVVYEKWQYYSKLLTQAQGVLKTQTSAVNKIICAIDGKENCDSEAQNPGISSGGGGNPKLRKKH